MEQANFREEKYRGDGRHVYDAYGQRSGTHRAQLAYAGAVAEAAGCGYLLGGRIYEPVLRRFFKPDSLSPFAAGGLNRYAYCGGDPIGRVDPGGQNWLSWLVSTLERLDFPITTARDAGGVENVFATPTLRAVETLREESLSLRSAIESTTDTKKRRMLIKAYGAARVPIAGPDAKGTFVFTPSSGMLGVQWPRRGNTSSTTFFTPEKRTIHAMEGPLVFMGDQRRAEAAARGQVKSHWLERTNRAGGVVLAATTSVGMTPLRDLKKFITHKYREKKVTIFAGAHGTPSGNHWADDGTPRYPERKFHDKIRNQVDAWDWPVTVLDYSDVRAEGVRSLMKNGDGVYVHYTCFGAADPVFMSTFNIRDITVRLFDDVSAPPPV